MMEPDAVQVSLNSESRGSGGSSGLSAHKVEIIGRFFSVSSRRGAAPETEQTGVSVNVSLPINFLSFRTIATEELVLVSKSWIELETLIGFGQTQERLFLFPLF